MGRRLDSAGRTSLSGRPLIRPDARLTKVDESDVVAFSSMTPWPDGPARTPFGGVAYRNVESTRMLLYADVTRQESLPSCRYLVVQWLP